jgi:hypothetical protein
MPLLDRNEFDRDFAHGLHTVQVILLGVLVWGGAVAFILFRIGPIFGSIIMTIAILLALAIVVYMFGRTLHAVTIRRKKVQPSLHCAYCKDAIHGKQTIACPSCGSVQHEDCYRANGCATFACKNSREMPVLETQK